jgi:hypothetical protein
MRNVLVVVNVIAQRGGKSKIPMLYSMFDFFVDLDCNHLSLSLEN